MTNRIRNTAAALLFLGCLVTLTSAFDLPDRLPNPSSRFAALTAVAKPAQHRTMLTLADRVAYQRAIEEVYWRHRIWPKENSDPKPSLDAVMSQAELEKKVADYLRNSQALENYWQKLISAEQLQAEMERMAQHTKQPEVLHELFEALGNDPLVIAECLARPALSERLLTDFYAHDQRLDGELRWGAEAGLPAYPSVLRMMPREMAAVIANYTLPTISDANACSDDTWVTTQYLNAPIGRDGHTAVWTGSEMIVWGGQDNFHWVNTGGKYNPTTDSWTATSTRNAPSARASHTAIWTGSEMIIWGGGLFNTGGRYNPATDSWIATSTTNAPSPRYNHTAVWTGGEMIIWGGTDGSNALDTGGRYSPGTNSWIATSTTNAPPARDSHTAVWSGTEMIVWGGEDSNYSFLNSGSRYHSVTNSWTAISTTSAPSPRYFQTAVWTGSEMIVWGGSGDSGVVNTGARYNPQIDSWITTGITNVLSARYGHTAVWTGSEMIVWGGTNDRSYLDTGARYNPGTDYWTATSTTHAPDARSGPTAIWTGSEMIVWGGVPYFSTGGRYCAQPSAIGPPVVTTNPPTYLTSFSATLNGSLDPHRLPTTVYFQYGTTVSYGLTTAAQTQTGNTYRTVSANISSLSPNTIYHFRIIATNSDGNRDGSDRTFTTLSATGAPVVTTNPATNVASFSTTLNGSLDPHGLPTTVYFQYGTTTSYGFMTAAQSQTGNTYRNVIANIGGLRASTIYHFRIVATNSTGTRYGSENAFATLSATGPPVVTTSTATNVASSSATLNGSLDPHGLPTTVHFQYGTTTSYGLATATQSKTGNTYQNVATNISGLTASTTYHFRMVATNSAGTRYGSDKTFTTP